MPIENVENMISMNIFNPTKWSNNRYLNLKEYNEYYTKFLKLSNLSINTLDDLAEAVTPPIYYLFSSVRKYFFNEGLVEKSLRTASFSPVFYEYEVYFFTKIYFYDEPLKIGRKMEVKLTFMFNDLFNEENPLFRIKNSINEELEKSTDLINFNKDFITLNIGYTINHPTTRFDEVIEGFEQYEQSFE